MKPALQHNATWRLTSLRSLITGVRCRGLLAVVIGGALLGVVVVLLPDADGRAAHVRLGLQSCSFLARTGYPCFGCGMTTAVTAMARGQVAVAFGAQAFGAVSCIAVFLAVIVGAIQAVTGRNLFGRVRPRIWWILIVITAWLLSWAYKVAAGIAAGQYPVGR